MRKLKIITLIIIGTFSFTSCYSSMITASGGYSDISLNVNSDEFEIVRLEPVVSVSTQIFGIPNDEPIGYDIGNVNRFYSFNSIGTKKWMPIASLAVIEIIPMSISITGFSLANYGSFYTGVGFLGMGLAVVAAGINNAIWSPLNRAKQRLNRKLIENNPNVDVFLNPKYTIDNKLGFFTSTSRVSLSAMGATIKKTNEKEGQMK